MYNISALEAIQLLKDGRLTGDYSISFQSQDEIEVPIALKFRKIGIEVPDNVIKYPDELGTEVDDEDFSGDWIPIESDLTDHLNQLTIKLNVDSDVKEWLESSNFDIDSLISELLTGFFKTTQAIRSDN